MTGDAARRRTCDGVLIVDKPRGPTSHDVVARLRRTLGTREVGHAGTLDPMATGVLVVAVGEATKLVAYLTADDKSYDATLSLGAETDTLDAEGRVTRELPISPELSEALRAGAACVRHEIVAQALQSERARTSQIPPAVSAIRVAGERAHDRARRGEVVLLAPRSVQARSIEVTGAGLEPAPWIAVRLTSSKGYYVRSFARDFAASMLAVAHLTALRRLRSGAFDLGDAVALDAPRETLQARMLPVAAAAARTLPVVTLTADGVTRARQGKVLPVEAMRDAPSGQGPAAWVDEDGDVIAIGACDADGLGRVVRGFRERG